MVARDLEVGRHDDAFSRLRSWRLIDQVSVDVFENREPVERDVLAIDMD